MTSSSATGIIVDLVDLLSSSHLYLPTMSKPKSMHTTYPMVSERGSEPDPKPNYGRIFLHVGAAAIMVKGFTALSGLAVGKVVTPQVGFCNPVLELQS
jgi:hypothetical protein